MPDVVVLQQNVQSVLDSMRSYVETASDLTGSPSDGFLPIVWWAMLRRQFDSLEAISHLVAEKKGYAAGPLLRPACEELIWVKYLAGITSVDAEELLRCVAGVELLESLRAQDDYGGRTVSKELGLLSFLENAVAREDAVHARLCILGSRLGWPRRTIEPGQLPKVSWLASKTGQQKVYKFLYHATSRFVHFSYRYSAWVSGVEAQLEDLYVALPARGLQVGTRLLQGALARAAQRDTQVVGLNTNERNEVAVRLYRRAGCVCERGRWEGGRQLWFERPVEGRT